jgi:citrate lyase subunit beta / citryl-CoA lyase
MRIRRSLIEVPGNVQRMVDKARGFEADVIMLDLEDSVPVDAESKAEARQVIADAVTAGGFLAREVAVRVNMPSSEFFSTDVDFVSKLGVSTIIVPKAYSAEEVLDAEAALKKGAGGRDINIIVIVETPGVLLGLPRISAESELISGLMSGGFDYTLETGSMSLLAFDGAMDDSHLVVNRQQVLAHARARGWNAMDGLLVGDPKDFDDVRTAATRSRRLGFDGCALYYPPHVPIVNEVMSPSPAELKWADEVVTTYSESNAGGRAAVYVAGRAVLPQHYKIAKRLKELAADLGV